jgi:hypothetical protein
VGSYLVIDWRNNGPTETARRAGDWRRDFTHPDDVDGPARGVDAPDVYNLRTNGSMDLPHMTAFSPNLELDLLPKLADRGTTIDSLPAPRTIKTHCPYKIVPKGPGRYIYVMRHGLDVMVSLYHQSKRIGFRESIEEFYRMFLSRRMGPDNWFDHVSAWVANPRGLNVLYVTYEELQSDFLGTARRLAEFCGVSVPESEWPRIVHNCSFEFMRAHEHKFDDLVRWDGDPEDQHFIRRGKVGGWRSVVTPDMQRSFEAQASRRLTGRGVLDLIIASAAPIPHEEVPSPLAAL